MSSRRVLERCERETASYRELHESIDARVTAAQSDIGQLETRLEEARRERRNREEYEAVSRVINSQPPREALAAERARLEADMAALRKASDATDRELEGRRKQFGLLMQALADIQRALGEEEADKAAAREGEGEGDGDGSEEGEVGGG